MPADAVTASSSPTPGPRRRLRWLWLALFTLIVGLAVVAPVAIVFGPQIVARQVVRTYLDGLNIDTSGVETLRIRPARGELSFGPVTFRGDDAQVGKVGRIGVSIDITRLLSQQALVRSIVIEGVRFEVRQADDGGFSLNGIPLGEILARRGTTSGAESPATREVPPPARTEQGTPDTLRDELRWGAGLDLLEVRDSRIVFIDARGGEAVMHVHRLELGDFRTWAPDKPGRYRLDAELNEIAVTAAGTAKPFADKIEVEAEAALTGIEVGKIERFLGPLGFTSRAGRIDLAVQRASIAVLAEGRLDARMAATGTLTDVDLAHPLFGSGRLATGTLTLDDVAGSYNAARETTLRGDLGIDLQRSAMRLGDGSEAAFARVRFGLPATRVRTAPGLQPEVRVAPQLDIEELRLGGPDLRGSIGGAAVRLSGFSIEGAEPGAPFQLSGSIAVERIDLLLPQADAVTIQADRLQVDLAETRLAFPPGRGARVEGGLAVDAHALAVVLQPPGAAGRAPPPPSRIAAGRLALEMPALRFDDSGSGGSSMSAGEPQVSIDAFRFDGPGLRGSLEHAALRLARVGLDGSNAPLVASGSIAIDRLDLLLPGDEPISIVFRRLQAELAETQVPLQPGSGWIAGSFGLDTRELLVTLQEQGRDGRPPPPTRIEAARVTAAVPRLQASKAGAPVPAPGAAKPSVSVEQVRLGGADIQGTIGRADLRFGDVTVEAGAPGPPVVITASVLARDLDLLVPDVEPVGIVARELDAELRGTRFAFPPRRVLIEGGVALDSKALAILVHPQQPAAGEPAPPPLRVAAARFAGEISRLVVDERRRQGVRVVVGTPKLRADQFHLDLPGETGTALQLASPALTLRRGEVSVITGGGVRVAGAAEAAAPKLALVLAPQPGGSEAPRTEIAAIDVALPRFGYQGGEAGSFEMQGRIGVGTLEARLPPHRPGAATDRLSLKGLALDVAELAMATGGESPPWRARLDCDLRQLSAAIDRPLAVAGTLENLSLRALDASAGERYALAALTLGRVDAAITRTGAAGPREPRPPAESEVPVWPPADLPAVRIGRLALLDEGRIAFRDASVSPSVNAALVLDALSLDTLDTTDPAARTRMRLRARLGDGGLSADGWAEPFQPRPSFAVEANIDDLPLPLLSPYLGPEVGLDILRGTLTVAAAAAATAGQVDGTMRTRLAGLRVADRPGGDDAPVSRAIGVPLSTMVRLLEDRDGGIGVTLPLRGDLLSPEVSYRGAIWSLLPRVLRAFVRSPVRFVSSAAALAAAMSDTRTAEAAAPPPPSVPDVAPAGADLAAEAPVSAVLRAAP